LIAIQKNIRHSPYSEVKKSRSALPLIGATTVKAIMNIAAIRIIGFLVLVRR
jgi:hypothetical protein